MARELVLRPRLAADGNIGLVTLGLRLCTVRDGLLALVFSRWAFGVGVSALRFGRCALAFCSFNASASNSFQILQIRKSELQLKHVTLGL